MLIAVKDYIKWVLKTSLYSCQGTQKTIFLIYNHSQLTIVLQKHLS